MSGKLVGIFIVVTALIGGVALYALLVYFFFDEVAAEDVTLRLSVAETGEAEALSITNLQAIDGTSSPLKFRACFQIAPGTSLEGFKRLDRAEPLTAPSWFDCFDADAIGAAVVSGAALTYLGEAEIRDGVDRVVAIFPDGQGFAWHQLNEKYQE